MHAPAAAASTSGSAEAQPDDGTPPLGRTLRGFTCVVAGWAAAQPGVAWLELARPGKHNAFHGPLWEEYPRALRQLDADEATRVIVVAAQGPSFCAGIDTAFLASHFGAALGATPPAPPPPTSASATPSASAVASSPASRAGPCPGALRSSLRRGILGLQDALSAAERCEAPVLAAVHGRCIGGGVDLITAADLRLAATDATFCVKEVDLAIAADLGTLQRLPHIVGHGAAMDLALTARTIGAAEAARLGLVSAVAERPDQSPAAQPAASSSSSSGGDGGRAAVAAAALRLAATLAAKPQLAVAGTKRVLLHARDHPAVADGLEYVATWNAAHLHTHDLEAALASQRPGARHRARL